MLFVFIAFAAVSERLRLGTVLGVLVGGVVIGPSGLGVAHELEAARASWPTSASCSSSSPSGWS
jgi:Kef-type K+ transport system membrane component KefB